MEGDKVQNYAVLVEGYKCYRCELCKYIASQKKHMADHLLTKKHKLAFETKNNSITDILPDIADIIKRKFKNCEDILKQIVEEKNQVYNIFQKKIKYSEENIDLVGDRLLKLIEEEIIIKKALLIFAEYDDPIEDC
tara:strand:+ start:1254 stop:1661 length:408 start_codon:yes stop_codon:yes gene_type:complete